MRKIHSKFIKMAKMKRPATSKIGKNVKQVEIFYIGNVSVNRDMLDGW